MRSDFHSICAVFDPFSLALLALDFGSGMADILLLQFGFAYRRPFSSAFRAFRSHTALVSPSIE